MRTSVADGLQWVAAHVLGKPAKEAGYASADVAVNGALADSSTTGELAEKETGPEGVHRTGLVNEVQYFVVTALPPGQLVRAHAAERPRRPYHLFQDIVWLDRYTRVAI